MQLRQAHRTREFDFRYRPAPDTALAPDTRGRGLAIGLLLVGAGYLVAQAT
ncbi:hypothetical protein [Halomonas sp.]|uniref:hypothetical protein n=1 Tax=Halomonas sp. TaxID=1486246 RepID=UPI0025B87041|nr:hypothetical protein [Halomonas sp.]